jgi:hypothetical protein
LADIEVGDKVWVILEGITETGKTGVVVNDFCEYGDHGVEIKFDDGSPNREFSLYSVEYIGPDKYEYACQLVKANGDVLPISDREWVSLVIAEVQVEQETQDNNRYQEKYGKNGITFRLVKRRKAGKVEVV